MNGKPNPTENFLISFISAFLISSLRPMWYVMRSHMGIQHTALIPVIVSGLLYGISFSLLSLTSAVNAKVVLLYAVLITVGYFRNTFQARHRRRVRDWDVSTWSWGESLFEPVSIFVCRRLYQKWGEKPFIQWLVGTVLKNDFIYYVVEPGMLVLVSIALWSIGSQLFFYPIILAISCIVVRNDAQLWLYLKAHEISDGKMVEQAVKSELEGPAQNSSSRVFVAEIPPSPFRRAATNRKSSFFA